MEYKEVWWQGQALGATYTIQCAQISPYRLSGELTCFAFPCCQPLLLPLLPPELQPAPGRLRHAVHVALLGVLLKLQDLLLAHHVPGLHSLLQIADTGQRIIGGVVLVPDKPAATSPGRDKLSVGGVLQIPGIIQIKPLEPPQLVTLHHITGHLPEQRVHMAETLSGIIEGYVVMAASQDRV